MYPYSDLWSQVRYLSLLKNISWHLKTTNNHQPIYYSWSFCQDLGYICCVDNSQFISFPSLWKFLGGLSYWSYGFLGNSWRPTSSWSCCWSRCYWCCLLLVFLQEAQRFVDIFGDLSFIWLMFLSIYVCVCVCVFNGYCLVLCMLLQGSNFSFFYCFFIHLNYGNLNMGLKIQSLLLSAVIRIRGFEFET